MASSGISDRDHAQTLLNRLNDQRKDGNYCDVRLKVAGRHLAAHSCVLVACSPFFQCVFERQNQLSVSLTTEILELDVPGMLGPLVGLESGGLEAVQGLLTYIYTGKIELNTINVELVVQLADVVMLDGLSVLARKVLKSGNLPSTCTSSCSSSVENETPEVQQIFVRHSPVGAAQDSMTPKPTVNMPKLPGKTPSVIQRRQCRTVLKRKPKQQFVLKNLTHFRPRVIPHTNSRGSDDDLAGSEASFSLTEHSETFRCQQCSFVSNNTREIRSHRKVHCGKAYMCNHCGFIAFQAHELLDHMLEKKHSETVCSLCGFKAQSAASFEEHLHKHNDRKPFFCASCSLRFRTRTALSLHLPEHATALKQVTGSVHSRASKNKTSLPTYDQLDHGAVHQISQKSIHFSHSRNFANSSSRSTELRDLKKRAFARVKLKPYKCELCGQRFSHAKNKQIHTRMHHFGTNQLEPSTQL